MSIHIYLCVLLGLEVASCWLSIGLSGRVLGPFNITKPAVAAPTQANIVLGKHNYPRTYIHRLLKTYHNPSFWALSLSDKKETTSKNKGKYDWHKVLCCNSKTIRRLLLLMSFEDFSINKTPKASADTDKNLVELTHFNFLVLSFYNGVFLFCLSC